MKPITRHFVAPCLLMASMNAHSIDPPETLQFRLGHSEVHWALDFGPRDLPEITNDERISTPSTSVAFDISGSHHFLAGSDLFVSLVAGVYDFSGDETVTWASGKTESWDYDGMSYWLGGKAGWYKSLIGDYGKEDLWTELNLTLGLSYLDIEGKRAPYKGGIPANDITTSDLGARFALEATIGWKWLYLQAFASDTVGAETDLGQSIDLQHNGITIGLRYVFIR